MSDFAAVERLYREHGDLVLRRARRIMGNDDEAREILQELFMSLVDRPQTLAGKTSIVGWLYGATTHLCLNTLRNRRTRARLVAAQSPPGAGAPSPLVESALAAQQLLARLPDQLAQVAVYYYFDEMTHDEIAELCGCSRRQVGNLLQQVQLRLQRGHE